MLLFDLNIILFTNVKMTTHLTYVFFSAKLTRNEIKPSQLQNYILTN